MAISTAPPFAMETGTKLQEPSFADKTCIRCWFSPELCMCDEPNVWDFGALDGGGVQGGEFGLHGQRGGDGLLSKAADHGDPGFGGLFCSQMGTFDGDLDFPVSTSPSNIISSSESSDIRFHGSTPAAVDVGNLGPVLDNSEVYQPSFNDVAAMQTNQTTITEASRSPIDWSAYLLDSPVVTPATASPEKSPSPKFLPRMTRSAARKTAASTSFSPSGLPTPANSPFGKSHSYAGVGKSTRVYSQNPAAVSAIGQRKRRAVLDRLMRFGLSLGVQVQLEPMTAKKKDDEGCTGVIAHVKKISQAIIDQFEECHDEVEVILDEFFEVK